MAEETKRNLQEMLTKINGLYCILISDRDGVPILKVNTDKLPDQATKPNLIAKFGLAIDQGSKLGLGRGETLICMYSQHQVIQMNKQPLMITFVASDTCNTGQILSLESQLDPIVAELKGAVSDS